MKFFKKLLGRVEDIAEDVGEGVVKLAKVLGREPTDAQLDKLQAKGDRLIARVRQIVAEELGDVPGMPDVAAEIIAQAAGAAANALFAGAIEGAKAANTDPQ